MTMRLSAAVGRTLGPGDEVVVTRLDHDANVRPWVIAAERAGATVRWAEPDRDTLALPAAAVEAVLSERTRWVAVTAASNATGTVPELDAIVAAAHAAGARISIDAVAAAPHRALSLAALGADTLACSAYKWYGPHVGILCAAPALLEELQPDKLAPSPEEAPDRFELGTLPFESLAGVTAAAEYLLEVGYDAIRAHEEELMAIAAGGLAGIEGVTLYGDPPDRVPTLMFNVAGRTSAEVAAALAEREVAVWDGNYYAWELERFLGLAPHGAVRAGFVHYNDAEDARRLVEAVRAVAEGPGRAAAAAVAGGDARLSAAVAVVTAGPCRRARATQAGSRTRVARPDRRSWRAARRRPTRTSARSRPRSPGAGTRTQRRTSAHRAARAGRRRREARTGRGAAAGPAPGAAQRRPAGAPRLVRPGAGRARRARVADAGGRQRAVVGVEGRRTGEDAAGVRSRGRPPGRRVPAAARRPTCRPRPSPEQNQFASPADGPVAEPQRDAPVVAAVVARQRVAQLDDRAGLDDDRRRVAARVRGARLPDRVVHEPRAAAREAEHEVARPAGDDVRDDVHRGRVRGQHEAVGPVDQPVAADDPGAGGLMFTRAPSGR